MAGGKHASRYKSFEGLEESRKERTRRMARMQQEAEEEEDYEDEYEDEEDEYEDEDESLLDYKKVIIAIVALIFIIALVFGIYKLVSGKDENKTGGNTTEQNSLQEEKMPTEISGYKVLGQVIIDDLNISQYILNLSEDKALQNGVSKIYGPSLNAHGNFCIVGHNYEGVFKDLEKLNVGDTITIKNAQNLDYTYKVTSVKTVEPDDLTPLLQDKQKIEMTFITCSTGSTSRIVVKAEQVADNG